MHLEAKLFLQYVFVYLNDYIKNNVLDVGSGDINGNNKYLFNKCNYIGVDIYTGTNVDLVSKCHELNYPDEYFDVIISSECFEHDMYYKKSIEKIIKLLKPNGLFFFTCASFGRPEHGTRRTTPVDSLTSKLDNEWSDYYKNITKEDILEIINVNKIFAYHKFYYNVNSKDLYFVGIKKSNEYVNINIPMYDGQGITCLDIPLEMYKRQFPHLKMKSEEEYINFILKFGNPRLDIPFPH